MNLKQQLKLHEGVEKYPYEDTVGKLTIGVGWNLSDRGLPDFIIDALLDHAIEEAKAELDRVFPVWSGLSRARKQVLVDMMFNLGAPRFMTFHRFRKALTMGQFDEAAKEMLDSKWAKQVGKRAERLAKMMRFDEFLEE